MPQDGGAGSRALIDQASTTVKPHQQEILDIDDTFCAAHGDQQLALLNAHHDERGFASTHLSCGRRRWHDPAPGAHAEGTEVRTNKR